MTFTMIVALMLFAFSIGGIAGIVGCALHLRGRTDELNEREARLANRELHEYVDPRDQRAKSIVKPYPRPGEPVIDESPAPLVKTYHTRVGELTAEIRDRMRRRHEHTKEYEALANVPRSERDRGRSVAAGALVATLRAERIQVEGERRKQLTAATEAITAGRNQTT